MARELRIHLDVVVPDSTDVETVLGELAGREFPSIPGSWISAAHTREMCPASATAPVGDAERSSEAWQDVEDAEADADAGLSNE